MPNFVGAVTGTDAKVGSAALAWFAGGERVGYDPKARVLVLAQGAALRSSDFFCQLLMPINL
ncbi:MAG TPA: hypothetical protein VMU57_14505 [Edaphobacter sp.]|uniref:hypothetical protein n=1 Tax=Edaphobacter sp. TaxID=1934404 RepID=UPI002C30B3A1|nr:hypothetical protein [Edaphobacter sp.]HUZ96115.1 hypothetical protein [Edaphobacter sp.]